MMRAVVLVWRPKRTASALLAAAVLLAGCVGGGSHRPVRADYTCAQLASDFRKPGDTADRGQAVVDSMVARIESGDRASTNVRDEIVYALASACSHRPSSWHPVAEAVRPVERIYRQR